MSVAVELARLGLSWGDLVQMRADLLAAIARANRDLTHLNEWDRQ